MKASGARRADVHARAQADGLEALEHGDVFSGVGRFGHEKKPCNLRISGLLEVYQTERPEEALARLARAAFSTFARSSSESIAEAQERASRAWSGVGSSGGDFRSAAGSGTASGSGPG